MKKKLLPLLLAAGVLLCTPALAAVDSAENFVRTKSYEGQFSDLSQESTFYQNVSALYEYGLSNGRPDGTYGLQAPMTRGEIYIFAGRIHSLYRTGDPEEGAKNYGGTEETPLSFQYLTYLKAERVVWTEVSGDWTQLSQPAARAEVAHVLAHVLPEQELAGINDQAVADGRASGQFLTDVTEETPYYEDILSLYRAGICAGSDETGTFHPGDPITRGAAAAMLTRVVDPALRITLDWTAPPADPAGSAGNPETPVDSSVAPQPDSQEITLGSLVEPGTYIASPTTGTEMDEVIRYMLASNSNQLTLKYGELSAVKARGLMEAALKVVKIYCEQSYNSASCTFSPQGDLTLTFSAAQVSTEQINEYRTATLNAALAAQKELWETGALTEDMTETEKARACFTWICDHCVYDSSAGDGSLSHIPYNLFENGTAVCDGYTGAYNLLLKLEGIKCMALSNDSHIWTVAELDGATVHIDATWGDSGETPNYSYFAMTPERSRQEHSW